MATRTQILGVVIAAAIASGAGCTKGKKGEATPPGPAAGDGASEARDAAALPAFDIEGEVATAGAGVGSSKERPVPTCGAAHSYDYVASDVVCGDGKSPLDGDLRAAMNARVGNVGPNEEMHVIDLYEVACPEGPKRVFIDMYDCERAQPTRSDRELEQLGAAIIAGDFAPFIQRCNEEAAKGEGRVSTMIKSCVPGMPAILSASGDKAGAAAWLKEWCKGASLEPDPDGDPRRFVYLNNVIETELELASQRGQTAAQIDASRPKLTAEYAKVCEVNPAEFGRWRDKRGE